MSPFPPLLDVPTIQSHERGEVFLRRSSFFPPALFCPRRMIVTQSSRLNRLLLYGRRTDSYPPIFDRPAQVFFQDGRVKLRKTLSLPAIFFWTPPGYHIWLTPPVCPPLGCFVVKFLALSPFFRRPFSVKPFRTPSLPWLLDFPPSDEFPLKEFFFASVLCPPWHFAFFDGLFFSWSPNFILTILDLPPPPLL